MFKRPVSHLFAGYFTKRYPAFSLSEVSPQDLAHDSVSRWLAETNCRPQDIWQAVKPFIVSHPHGVLVVDETVMDKSRSDKIDLVRW